MSRLTVIFAMLMGASCASTEPMPESSAKDFIRDELVDSMASLGMKPKRSYYPIEKENRAAYTTLFMERIQAHQADCGGQLSEADVELARGEAESMWKHSGFNTFMP